MSQLTPIERKILEDAEEIQAAERKAQKKSKKRRKPPFYAVYQEETAFLVLAVFGIGSIGYFFGLPVVIGIVGGLSILGAIGAFGAMVERPNKELDEREEEWLKDHKDE